MTQEKFIAKGVIGNCLTWSKLKNLMEKVGGGGELKTTFKLKLEVFHRKLFLKNEDKYLLPAYFHINFFIVDEEKCHS